MSSHSPSQGRITLHIASPAGVSGPLPGFLQIHGGAMVFLEVLGSMYTRLRDELAAVGTVAIGVDYRKAGGVHGHQPFPAGLEDCAAAPEWVDAHREQLGLFEPRPHRRLGGRHLGPRHGDQGQARRQGRPDRRRLRARPYISGAGAWDEGRRLADLPSWVETNGYFCCAGNVEVFVSIYDPEGREAENPPGYFAQREDLEGLPPHVISVNELDPVRDEAWRIPQAPARGRRRDGHDAARRVPRRRPHAARGDARAVRGDDRAHEELRGAGRAGIGCAT